MRIISGKYSGRKIITPKGKETRPTTDRFKETLFNVIENSLKIDLKEKNILDLFAGSGSLGLEAMSRGAKSCVFVDKSSKAIKAIEDNVNNLGLLSSSSNCINIDVNKIRKFKKNVEDKIDIIFSDPPYSKTDINEIAIGNLVKNSWIRRNSYLFLETSIRRPIKDIKDFQIIDDRKIGDSLLITYLYSNY